MHIHSSLCKCFGAGYNVTSSVPAAESSNLTRSISGAEFRFVLQLDAFSLSKGQVRWTVPNYKNSDLLHPVWKKKGEKKRKEK